MERYNPHAHTFDYSVSTTIPIVNLATYGMARLHQPDTPIQLSMSNLVVVSDLLGRCPLDIFSIAHPKPLSEF